MRFTIIELREVLPRKEANGLLNKLNSQSKAIPVKQVRRYIPFKSRYGTVGTQLQMLNQYDLYEIIELYEGLLVKEGYRHVKSRIVDTLKLLYRLKTSWS